MNDWRSFITLTAQIKICNDLDFLKDEPGTKDTPYVLDDGDLRDISAMILKAFLDMQAKEQIARGRWAGTKNYELMVTLELVCGTSTARCT